MAGFFLYQTNNKNIDVKKAMNSFEKKGLHSPNKYVLGNYSLLLYAKMTTNKPNVVETKNGFCCAVGTYIYKGLDYSRSLLKSIEDYRNHTLSLNEMYGQFTLIIHCNNRIAIVSDALYTKHIFTDKENQLFSSSFFAAVDSLPDVSLNRKAILEKMMVGVIATPDTIVNEVMQFGRNEQDEFNKLDTEIYFLVHHRKKMLPPHDCGRKKSVQKQAETISNYFKTIAPAFSSNRIDMGLSAGHDSTLIFAAAYPYFQNKLHLHTHSTGSVHNREKRAVEKIAQKKNLSVNIVPTPRLDEPGIDLQNLLNENLEFFDGRTSHDIGGFSATYRADYRIKATEACDTSITGVGGECLRNHYSVVGNKINADYYFDEVVFNHSFKEAVSSEVYQSIKTFHIKKAEKILDCKLSGKVKRLLLRRYYSEVLMPDGQGHVLDAYNLVSNCFSPFLDEHIVQEAYRGINYLGNCGEYESAIIVALDNDIGTCTNSNNGYPFNRIPISLRMKEAIRARVGAKIWRLLSKMKSGTQGDKNYFFSVLSKSPSMNVAFKNLENEFSDIDFNLLLQGYSMDANIEYLAMTIWRIENDRKFNL